MKKFFRKLCAALLTVLLITSAAYVPGVTVSAEEEVFILPQSVDNSTSPYFPEIGNQGSMGSCTSWAHVYYSFTYAINKSRGIKTTPENTYSPQWSYNLTSNGEGEGSTSADIEWFLEKQGAVPLSMVPYKEDPVTWCSDLDVWRESINNRLADTIKYKGFGERGAQITSPSDPKLTEVKTALAKGEILTFSTEIYSWVTTKLKSHKDAPGNESFVGEEAVKYLDGGEGSHAMTIVGYNDNIWVDINENNKVDSGEMGAFKIANSWGEGYANKGFCWVAYDAINKVSSVQGGFAGNRGRIFEGFKWITVKPYSEGAKIYVRFTLNTADRVQMNVDFASECNGIDESNKILRHSSYRHDGNRLSFDGTKNAIDGTFCYALDNVSPELCAENFNNYNFYANFEDTDADGKKLEVKNVEVVNEHTGKVYKMASEPFSVDGEKKTVTLKDAALSILIAILGIAMCYAFHHAEHLGKKWVPNAWLRIALGGAIIALLTFLVGDQRFNGAGMDMALEAVAGHADWYSFALKLLFTAVTLAAGFKGGEIVPTFCIGATFGCVVGPLLGLDPGISAAIGLVGLFCCATNSPLTAILLSMEMFGSTNLYMFAWVSVVCFVLSGHSSLYTSQIIRYHKTSTEGSHGRE